MSDDEDFPEEELNLGHYEGERNESDQRHGFGKAYFPNGDVYEGAYENGKRHGKGLYKFANGCRYDGSYLWNRRDGEGVMIFPDGSKYEGNWSEDCRHGNGKYYYVNGDTYDGEWSKNLKNGQGTYTDNQTNSETRGFWHHGKLHGLVKITLGDHIYVGSYDKTAISGEGKFIFPKGHVELLGRYEVTEKVEEISELDEEEPKKIRISTWITERMQPISLTS